jgi:hypothetical protein
MKPITAVALSLATATAALVSAPPATAAEPLTPDVERPQAESGPTRVEVTLYLIDLTAVDGATQSFTADLFVVARWIDPRLASPDGRLRRFDLEDIWSPRLLIVNQRAVRTGFPDTADVTPDGTVTARQRYFGQFSAPLDLHDFPMDRHTIRFVLAAPGYPPDEVELVAPVGDAAIGRAQNLSIVDWTVGPFTSLTRPYEIGRSGQSIAGFVGELEVDRKLGFYVSKAFVSVAIIVAMSWAVFWLDPKHVPARLSVSVTAMLTLIAYRFLLGQVLPPLSYLTRMDHFLLGSTLLVLLGLIEVIASTHLHGTDRPERALSLNRISRVAFALAFALLLVASFWAP